MVDAIDGLEAAVGALVTSVPAGPAEDAGMEAGDVITTFDGIVIEDTRELVRIVGNSPVGKEVPVIVLRNGDIEDLVVVLGRRETSEAAAFPAAVEEPVAPQEPQTVLGMMLSEITPEHWDSCARGAGHWSSQTSIPKATQPQKASSPAI